MSLNTSLFDIFFRSFVFSIRFFFLLLYFITLQMKKRIGRGKKYDCKSKKDGKKPSNELVRRFSSINSIRAHLCLVIYRFESSISLTRNRNCIRLYACFLFMHRKWCGDRIEIGRPQKKSNVFIFNGLDCHNDHHRFSSTFFFICCSYFVASMQISCYC